MISKYKNTYLLMSRKAHLLVLQVSQLSIVR
jgi:hypothetical protein